MAKKRGKGNGIMNRLTKTDKFAILWLNHLEQDPENIAKTLELPLQKVKNTIKSHKAPETESLTQKALETTQKQKQYSDMMITRSQGQDRPVSIMTKEASSLTDNRVSNRELPSANIFKIKE